MRMINYDSIASLPFPLLFPEVNVFTYVHVRNTRCILCKYHTRMKCARLCNALRECHAPRYQMRLLLLVVAKVLEILVKYTMREK